MRRRCGVDGGEGRGLPYTTKRDVEYELLGSEEFLEIACGCRVGSGRRTPRHRVNRRITGPSLNILRHVAALKETNSMPSRIDSAVGSGNITYGPVPHIKPRHVHLQSERPASRHRKLIPPTRRSILTDETSLSCRAVRLQGVTRVSGVGGQVTPVRRVQCHLVVGHHVDALDDVDFTAVGPFYLGS